MISLKKLQKCVFHQITEANQERDLRSRKRGIKRREEVKGSCRWHLSGGRAGWLVQPGGGGGGGHIQEGVPRKEGKGTHHLTCMNIFRTYWAVARPVVGFGAQLPGKLSKWIDDQMGQLLTSEKPKHFTRKKIGCELTAWLGCEQYLPGSQSANTDYWFNKKKKKWKLLGK